MKLHLFVSSFRVASIPALVLLMLPLAALAQSAGAKRVELPGAEGKPFPYTVEIPQDWELRQVENEPGVWLGPKGADPGKDPRMVYVRISRASLADPEAVAANIRANDQKSEDFTAPLVEVREIGGVKGVLLRMDSGRDEGARSTLVLKMPLEKTSVDFMASAGAKEFETLRPSFERVLLSVRPREQAKN
ncbi:MAG TPA: hypothetical protein VMW27_07295 [Thermoanaerobaculia bacterium]|nr:hypothetical protein [Thermoanaerobaculia bacterium]